MKGLFKYPLIIMGLCLAIVIEAYEFKEDIIDTFVSNNIDCEKFFSDNDENPVDIIDKTDDTIEQPVSDIAEANDNNDAANDGNLSAENPEAVLIEGLKKVNENGGDLPTQNPTEVSPVNPDSQPATDESGNATGEYIVEEPLIVTKPTTVSTQTCLPNVFEGVEYVSVDDTYFNDACFVGDSRIVGLWDYGGIKNASFYCKTGLNIYNLFEADLRNSDDASKVKFEDVLHNKQFGKIYIMVGINELGRDTDAGFGNTYAAAVNHIHELQPNAIIYVQSIQWVTASKSSSDELYNNVKINSRNDAIKTFIDNNICYYLDVNSVYDDGTGNLCEEYSGDKVHLYAKYYYLWTDFLKCHAVNITNE